MIIVFNANPIALGPFTTFNIVNSRAATAAAEATNLIEWLVN